MHGACAVPRDKAVSWSVNARVSPPSAACSAMRRKTRTRSHRIINSTGIDCLGALSYDQIEKISFEDAV